MVLHPQVKAMHLLEPLISTSWNKELGCAEIHVAQCSSLKEEMLGHMLGLG